MPAVTTATPMQMAIPAALPRPVGGVVFDLDGTLVDTEPAYREAFTAALAEIGHRIRPADYQGLVGLPSPARRRLLAALFGEAFPIDAFFTAYYRQRSATLAGGIGLKPGAAEVLDLLRTLGLPCAIATSASAATAASHLAATGLAGRIATIVTRDDVAHGKPAPDSFIAAAASLGLAPRDCLAVEDSPHGVRAAWSAGLMTVMVPDSLPPTSACRERCVAILGDLHALSRLLGTAARETAPT